MDTEGLAVLLERIVDQNERMISLLENVLDEVRNVNSELDWASQTSFAKQVCDSLQSVETTLNSRG